MIEKRTIVKERATESQERPEHHYEMNESHLREGTIIPERAVYQEGTIGCERVILLESTKSKERNKINDGTMLTD